MSECLVFICQRWRSILSLLRRCLQPPKWMFEPGCAPPVRVYWIFCMPAFYITWGFCIPLHQGNQKISKLKMTEGLVLVSDGPGVKMESQNLSSKWPRSAVSTKMWSVPRSASGSTFASRTAWRQTWLQMEVERQKHVVIVTNPRWLKCEKEPL